MSDSQSPNAAEDSPLLGNPSEQVARPALKGSGSNHYEQPNDVESDRQILGTEDPDIVRGRKKLKSLLPVLGVGIFLSFLDQSVVATINGEIGNDMHALNNVSWVATAYFLTMAASQPLYGKLSDVFGRKPCLMFAYFTFGIGSLGCGVARSMEEVIGARVGQSVGFMMMMMMMELLKVVGNSRSWRRRHNNCCHRPPL